MQVVQSIIRFTINTFRKRILALEWSSSTLEIPNDAYTTTLSQNLIGCSTLSQEYSKIIGW